MRRAEIYRLKYPKGDPKRARSVVVVSRQGLIDSSESTVVCAPIYTARLGLATTVDVGPADGLKHDSSIRCDLMSSVPKAALTDYVGMLDDRKIEALDQALRVALALDEE